MEIVGQIRPKETYSKGRRGKQLTSKWQRDKKGSFQSLIPLIMRQIKKTAISTTTFKRGSTCLIKISKFTDPALKHSTMHSSLLKTSNLLAKIASIQHTTIKRHIFYCTGTFTLRKICTQLKIQLSVSLKSQGAIINFDKKEGKEKLGEEESAAVAVKEV